MIRISTWVGTLAAQSVSPLPQWPAPISNLPKMETSHLPWIGLSFLTYNSAMAVYRSQDDFYAISFVLTAYLSLLLLFWCLRSIERAGPNAPQRGRLKAYVWFLCTLLTGMFSYKVAAVMPWPVDLVVWGLASSVIIGGFYVFFLHRDGN